MMQSYDGLSRFMVFGIQPVERVQALPALLRVSPLYDASRLRQASKASGESHTPINYLRKESFCERKNKNIILSFRVTPEEKTWIEEQSYGHYRRISDFVRDCIFKKEIVNIDGADEIARELQRIGNNLNQLTRAVNAGFVRAVDLGETKREVQKVWQSLNSLLRDAR